MKVFSVIDKTSQFIGQRQSNSYNLGYWNHFFLQNLRRIGSLYSVLRDDGSLYIAYILRDDVYSHWI